MLKVLSSLMMCFFFVGVLHANPFEYENKLTEDEFRKLFHQFDKYGYICRTAIYRGVGFKSKPLKYPYPYSLDYEELGQLFTENLKKNLYKDFAYPLCEEVRKNQIKSIESDNYQSTDVELDTDYTKNIYVTFELRYIYSANSYDVGRYLISNTVFMKELPLNLTDSDYSQIYKQSIDAILAARENTNPKQGTFKVGKGASFAYFRMHISKGPNNSSVEYVKKQYLNVKVIDSWEPEFISKPTQSIQSVNTAVEKTTQKTQDKPSVPTTAPNKSEAIQKAEQEKIIKAEIKKEVAVAQLENKAQLTQDKTLPVVKKVDDDVQKALKKIPKKEKKKVELKPYLETVVVCTPPSERGSFKCYGPNGSFSGHPNQPKGYKTPEEVVTMNMKWSCPDQKRFASVNNHSIWGCGQGATGSTSSKDSSQGLPIPERATYYCKPKQIGCKNQSPTQAEN